MKKSTIVILVILGILVIDQALKIYVKTTMEFGSSFTLLGFDWARIHFTENPGMAFGKSLDFLGEHAKIGLSLFRIVMIGFLIYLLRGLIKTGESLGLVVCFGMIVAGAIGNMIDSAFYGMIFTESGYHHREVATMFSEAGGYAPFLYGSVVDMLYFPLIKTHFPNWFPVWGGESFEFFRPVFNIADSSITCGVTAILLFHRDFFASDHKPQKVTIELPDTSQEEASI